MAKEITLITEHALSETREESAVRERGAPYAASFTGWDDFVASVLPWLTRTAGEKE